MTEKFWTWLVIRISGPDALALPLAEGMFTRWTAMPAYGPSGQTREQAHADVAQFLEAAPPEGESVRKSWAAGAKDDTVYLTTPDGMIVFAILPYAGDRPERQIVAVEEWVEEFTANMRAAVAGFDIQVSMPTYRIEADVPLRSDWLPASAFTRVYTDRAAAVATAIEGVDDPAEDEVRVVCVETGEIVWRSTEHEYE